MMIGWDALMHGRLNAQIEKETEYAEPSLLPFLYLFPMNEVLKHFGCDVSR